MRKHGVVFGMLYSKLECLASESLLRRRLSANRCSERQQVINGANGWVPATHGGTWVEFQGPGFGLARSLLLQAPGE